MNVKANRSRDLRIIVAAFVGIIIWICGINILSIVTGKFSGMNLFGCTFMNPLIILMGMATLNLAVTSRPRSNNRINELSKFSLLIYLFHANYFWLTYGKYAWIEFLCNNGLSLLAAVGINIVCYVLITPCLSWVYSKLFNRGLGFCVDKISVIFSRALLALDSGSVWKKKRVREYLGESSVWNQKAAEEAKKVIGRGCDYLQYILWGDYKNRTMDGRENI